ncbi:MAG TPA: transposase [Geobacteraceae bacterium]
MPRIAHIISAGYPHHITQRGNNRATVFFDDEDRQAYLNRILNYTRKYDVAIWAYCLMSNHVHLLAVPETETGLARGIGLTNLLYTQYLNRKLNQSGRIWQNRFFSCIVENNQYLWGVARYIERNPVKAGLAATATAYPWSSAAAHVTESCNPLLAEDSWLAPDERVGYAAFLDAVDEEMDDGIRRATRTGRPFGSEQFIGQMEFSLNQRLRPEAPGRPRKNGEVSHI